MSAVSLSSMVTVVSSGFPALTRGSGMVPNPRVTVSLSSSIRSSTASIVKVWDRAPPSVKVTLGDTE